MIINPFNGTSTLATALRVGAFAYGTVYGSLKLRYLRHVAIVNRQKRAAEQAQGGGGGHH